MKKIQQSDNKQPKYATILFVSHFLEVQFTKRPYGHFAAFQCFGKFICYIYMYTLVFFRCEEHDPKNLPKIKV